MYMLFLAQRGLLSSAGGMTLWASAGSLPVVRCIFSQEYQFLLINNPPIAGGISMFSEERGFVCDSVINMQVVLASGAIVNANATENSELFIALKGGQSNFGVVTRFDVRAFAQGSFWGGLVQYPSSADDAQLAAYEAVMSAETRDPHVAVEQSFLFQSGSDEHEAAHEYSCNLVYYTKPAVDAPALRPFTQIQPQEHSTMRFGGAGRDYGGVDQVSAC
jgi:hypothetical protein